MQTFDIWSIAIDEAMRFSRNIFVRLIDRDVQDFDLRLRLIETRKYFKNLTTCSLHCLYNEFVFVKKRGSRTNKGSNKLASLQKLQGDG